MEPKGKLLCSLDPIISLCFEGTFPAKCQKLIAQWHVTSQNNKPLSYNIIKTLRLMYSLWPKVFLTGWWQNLKVQEIMYKNLPLDMFLSQFCPSPVHAVYSSKFCHGIFHLPSLPALQSPEAMLPKFFIHCNYMSNQLKYLDSVCTVLNIVLFSSCLQFISKIVCIVKQL